MLKQQAIQLFGGAAAVGRAVGVTTQAITRWPQKLTARQSDRVIAALVRVGRHEEARALSEGGDAPKEAQP